MKFRPANENVLQALRSGPIDPRQFVVPRIQGLRGESINTLIVQVVQSKRVECLTSVYRRRMLDSLLFHNQHK
jgi:hypothetical protein